VKLKVTWITLDLVAMVMSDKTISNRLPEVKIAFTHTPKAIEIIKLKEKAIKNENVFEQLMEATKTCSLGQITNALFEVGGQYRRNM